MKHARHLSSHQGTVFRIALKHGFAQRTKGKLLQFHFVCSLPPPG